MAQPTVRPNVLGPDGAPLPPSTRARGATLGTGYRGVGRGSWYDGASFDSQEMAAWQPSNPSAQVALTYERDTLATRIHDMARNDGWASTAVQRQVDAIIGAGWRRVARPNARRLGIDEDAAQALGEEIEAAFKDYSEDFMSCDAGQRMSLGAILALNFRHRIQDGEALSISLWLDRGQDWKTAIQTVDPDRLSNPNLYLDSVSRRAGVDLGAWGEPTGYHIRSAHPGDWGVLGAYPWIWDQLPRHYRNGRWCVVHSFEAKRAGQVRGEPPMAPILDKVRMLGRYDRAELQAALLNALLAAFIKSKSDADDIADSLQPAGDRDDLALRPGEARRLGYYERSGIRLPGVALNFLYPDDEVQLTHATHPNVAFEHYYRVGLRYIAAASNLSYEQLTGDFSQTNYAGFRGAMLEIYRGFTARQSNFGASFLDPHYSNWLEEALESGRVAYPKGAPRFRAARAAYCGGSWVMPARGWVDPIKEADAAVARLSVGLSTYQRECAEQGMDWREVIRQRALERKEMIAAGLDPDALIRAKLPRDDQAGVQDPPPANRQTPKPTRGNPDDDA
jgi:lambda family phage portal protein